MLTGEASDQTFYISAKGLSRCPRCGRHVVLADEVARTRCPFCDAGILEMPSGRMGPTEMIAALGGRTGRVAAALQLAGGRPPSAAPARDPGMSGDPRALWRLGDIDPGAEVHARHAVWELTLQCDLGCRHCGSRAGRARNEELSTAECLDVIAQLRDLGVREITLIGGEAYLRADWSLIAERIVASGMVCTMTTGARNLTSDRVRAAADAGIHSIGVSIDGLEATHDAMRGAKGSWRAAVDAANCIAGSAIRLSMNSQLNALTAPEIPALARLLVDIGSTAWQVQLTVPMGRAADRPRLLLQPVELLDLYPLLVWTKEYILERHGIALVPGNNIGYFSHLEQFLRYGGTGYGAHYTACEAGQSVIGIEADGSIKGCPSLPSRPYVGGNVREAPIRTIVTQRPEVTHLKRRTRDNLWGFCAGCYYGDVCLGGCSWTSHCVMGRPGNNPYCSHRAVQLAAEGLAERLVQVEGAAGVPFDAGRFAIVQEPLLDDTAVDSLFGIPVAEIVSATPRAGSVRPSSSFAAYLAPRKPPANRRVLQTLNDGS